MGCSAEHANFKGLSGMCKCVPHCPYRTQAGRDAAAGAPLGGGGPNTSWQGCRCHNKCRVLGTAHKMTPLRWQLAQYKTR